jgi:hypothetical protein
MHLQFIGVRSVLLLQIGDCLVRIRYDPSLIHEHGDSRRPGYLLKIPTLLRGGRNVDQLVVDTELGELGPDAMGEGAPFGLVEPHNPLTSLIS